MSKGNSRKGRGAGRNTGRVHSTRKRSARRAEREAAAQGRGPGPLEPAIQKKRGPVHRRGDVSPSTGGAPRTAKQDVDDILAFFALRQGFDAQTEREAGLVAAWDVEAEAGEQGVQRDDLRSLRAVTIDGDDARDFDDAVSIEPIEGGGARLGVHIADVGWYVRPGTLLDAQAQIRGTSAYLPDRVLPMLPEALSNGCCSLLPGQDRLTVSALIDCGADGHVLAYRLTRSVIRSRERLTYTGVNRLLDGDPAGSRADLLPDLQRMAALAAKLRGLRLSKGALDLDVREASIAVDSRGEPADISVRARGAAERMIEEFMLLANRVVAGHAKARGLPCLYRVHEPMDPDKAAAFSAFARGLGLRLRDATPRALQRLLQDAEALPEYPVIAQLLLRALQKARYDAEPLGHFGLAADDYCHFTAPIRRYPDLFVHRALCAEMSGELRFAQRAMEATAPGLSVHCSERERNAMEAERAVEKLMMARYMAGRIGEAFDGMVVSVVEWGLYVALPNTVEGLVHVRTLPGYWTLNRELHCLVGSPETPAAPVAVYRLGQALRVRVEAVDVAARQIDLVVADAAPR
ncbi:MAG: VacB/RNase II family 3'-5' exoribonuclease [Clostridia bacterium]|nr:VacB/RNase II family 3'-5' exoribonuclease [Clostridia bacterium]